MYGSHVRAPAPACMSPTPQKPSLHSHNPPAALRRRDIFNSSTLPFTGGTGGLTSEEHLIVIGPRILGR